MSKQEELRTIVQETSGASLTIAPSEEGWSGYLLQKKEKFYAESCDEVCQKIIDYVKQNRTEASKAKNGKESKKPFKI